MTRVEIQPALFRWARERSRVDALELDARFPKLGAWEAGDAHPTFKQLENFAQATHTPIGYFFLPEPPVERLPIQDFRTLREAVARLPEDAAFESGDSEPDLDPELADEAAEA